MTHEQAFEFISRYGNVSNSIEQLKETAPTSRDLKNAREQCYAAVDRAIRLVAEYHGVDNPE